MKRFLAIIILNGRRVAQLPVGEHLHVLPNVDETENGRAHRPSPTHNVAVWRPDESLGSGVYLIRARFDRLSDQGEESVTKRLVYLK